MRKIALAAGGVFALALVAGASAASAGTLGSSGGMLLGTVQQQAAPEDVRWVRRCWQERVWWDGRWHWRTRCRSAWIGPRW